MQNSDGDDWLLEAAAAAAAARLEALMLSMNQRTALQVWRTQVGLAESYQALLAVWSLFSSRIDTLQVQLCHMHCSGVPPLL